MSARPPGAFTAGFAWPAPAKLNLFLHVTGRRADGYHELQTLFQFLDLADRLYFVPRGDGVIRRLDGPAEVHEADDLAVRAAHAIQRASGCNLGADIRIDKRIPIGAGLGGGSSDAATTLVALNRLWNLGLTTDELAQLGLHLGADVPVFVRGHAAWAEGVGERLSRMTPREPWYLVLVPPVAVSTAAIFGAAELRRDCPRITPADYAAGATINVCEPVTTARHPEVAEALRWLKRHGPARMSGTGAAVFLACDTRAQAEAIARAGDAPGRCFVVRGRNRSPLLDAAAR
ncbi:4-(cytidine 5'-diphospho)-2-C-methyl-D-erythritol kinase [Sinimarinibacterium thermocellulolyticum]|uniref:4-diphosphocytidyl-2-C-methyl-D-erythritol kinase n=1 Tax=Sinimarinibacterium thermocellulolyticum TaxID=3170016 RepID=A0ABV2AB92_9GAMM